MSKVVLFLSGSWTKSATDRVLPGDVVACAPGLRPSDPSIEFVTLTGNDALSERALADWMSGCCERAPDCVRPILLALANDYYSYSLVPALRVILALHKLLDSCRPSHVLVVTAHSIGNLIPLVGFQTLESSRGSKNLLFARVAAQLPSVFPDVTFEFLATKVDLLCVEPCRIAILRAANFLFTIGLGIRLLLLALSKSGAKNETRQNRCLVLVRTAHQARFAKRLLNAGLDADVLLVPQLSQGQFTAMKGILNDLSALTLTYTPSFASAVKAWFTTRSDVASINSQVVQQYAPRPFSTNGLTLPFFLRHLVSEVSTISVALYYKNLLEQELRSRGVRKLISFELVGRMAGLEALAARTNGIESAAIQSALIASSPLPVFPQVDTFFADSQSTRGSIAGNGSLRLGCVEYFGPPYDVITTRRSVAFRAVTFYSQPYEPEVTISIVSEICETLRGSQVSVRIRLHPRDSLANYATLFQRYSPQLALDDASDLIDSFVSTNLCITRTSSVIKEALSLGLPVLACLWSEFDLSVRADYLDSTQHPSFISTNVTELRALLNNPQQLIEASMVMSEAIFGQARISDLVLKVH